MGNEFSSPPAGAVHLNGVFGSALQKTIENRLKKINCGELVDPFRFRNEKDDKWRCEFWGKIVRSAILAWKDTGDPELLRIIETTVDDLLSTQTPDGCISSYPDGLQLSGWDIWGRKYVLSALVRYCETFPDHERVLQACCRMTEHLHRRIGTGKLTDFGQHYGLAAASILSPLVRLYRLSGNQVCMDLADSIVREGACHLHNVFAAAASGVPPAELGGAKAYEMTACFEGLCEYLKEKPEERFRESVLRYYEMVRDCEIFVTGTGGLKDSNGEFWYSGAKRQTWLRGTGSLGETCVTVSWLHFCAAVLNLTGDSRVADEMEKSFYNALLGAMHPDGHGWMHQNPTPLAGASGRRTTAEQIPGFGGHDCCLAQGPEGIAMFPEFSFRTMKNGILINGYESADCRFITPTGKNGKLQISGDYPSSGEIRLNLTLEQPETLAVKLRIPGWSETTEISIGEERFSPECGRYFTLERKWDRHAEISIRFDMNFRSVPDPGGSGMISFRYGPLVLAQDSRLTRVGNPVEGKDCGEVEARENIMFCMRVGNQILCDYASAGNAFSPENTLQVWMRTV